jgi:hypothetical protein
VWSTVEGTPEKGATFAAWAKSAALAQAGAVGGKLVVTGYLDCRATSHNPEYEAGTQTIRPLAFVVAKSMKDRPGDTTFERRRFPQNEHIVALRRRYPDIEPYVGGAASRYMVMAAKGEA